MDLPTRLARMTMPAVTLCVASLERHLHCWCIHDASLPRPALSDPVGGAYPFAASCR